jgi:branched-subunit amino acid transport protein
MTTWLAVLAVGLGSYAMRVGPLLLRDRFVPSPRVDDVIRHAGTAAVTALLVTACVRAWEANPALPTLAALTVGGVLALRGRSMVQIVVAGLLVQWALRLVTAGLA